MTETPEIDVQPGCTAADALDRIDAELAGAGIPTSRGDAEVIVAHLLGLGRAEVQAGRADALPIDAERLERIHELVAQRKRRVPLQHLTGISLFRDLVLEVGPGVFIPRRETEYVAELAIRALRASGRERPVAIDVGAGAGAIGLSIATEVPDSTVYGIELEPSAHDWLRRNVEAIAPRNAFAILGDMVDALPELHGLVDVVAGNPPWVPDGVTSPTPEVAIYERGARIYGGGEDGLDIMRGLSRTAMRWLRSDGTFVTEHGVSMGAKVRALLERDGWSEVRSHIDPRGKERVTTARRP